MLIKLGRTAVAPSWLVASSSYTETTLFATKPEPDCVGKTGACPFGNLTDPTLPGLYVWRLVSAILCSFNLEWLTPDITCEKSPYKFKGAFFFCKFIFGIYIYAYGEN